MSREDTEIVRFKEGVWVMVWRWGVILFASAGTLIGAYATMWVKLNAPTRVEFNDLSHIVQSLREDLIRRENQQAQIAEQGRRLDKLEEESRKRFPARGTTP